MLLALPPPNHQTCCYMKDDLQIISPKTEKGNEEKKKAQKRAYYQRTKEVRLAKMREYYKKNAERICSYVKQWKKDNKEYVCQRDKEHYRKNAEKIKASARKYAQENKEAVSARQKSYKERNRAKLNAKVLERKEIDVAFSLTYSLRSRLVSAVKRKSVKKLAKSLDLIGCSPGFLIKHLEKQFLKGMTWKNHGMKGWHIDHIVPCSSFDLTTEDQQRQCFHFSNLRPLWARDNLKKGKKSVVCQPELALSLA